MSVEPVQSSLVAQLVKNPPAMQETLVQFLGQEDPLEECVATHSSILAWKIPWTEEPGGLQSMGSQRVRHNWVTKHMHRVLVQGSPGGSDGKESACSAGDLGSIPGSGRSPEEGHGTHSSILVHGESHGQVPCTEEPGRLQSMVLQRVRHDWD